MSDQDSAEAIARAAAKLVPALTERLNRLGLGEIEIRHGDLRVRVAAADQTRSRRRRGHQRCPAGGRRHPSAGGAAVDAWSRSPRVGRPLRLRRRAGAGAGGQRRRRDRFVEMLGVRHGARPQRRRGAEPGGESGEPVEYGQLLVEVDRAASG